MPSSSLRCQNAIAVAREGVFAAALHFMYVRDTSTGKVSRSLDEAEDAFEEALAEYVLTVNAVSLTGRVGNVP